MNPTDYMLVLLQELERLLPAPSAPRRNHAITWARVNDEDGTNRDALVILLNLGDVLFPYTTTPGQLTTDPIETARRLAPAIEPDPHRFYTFK